MEIKLARGASWSDDIARIAIAHAEYMGVSEEWIAQMTPEALAMCVAVADVAVTIGGQTQTLRMARPPGYGMPTTDTFRGHADSVLATRCAYTITIRAIEGASPVVTLAVTSDEQPADAEIEDTSQLAPEHRAFIERWARMTYPYGPERDVIARGDTLEIDGKRLTRIFAGTCTLNPMSTGALDVTFWRGDDGSYWFVHAGGCIAYRSVLYGPY